MIVVLWRSDNFGEVEGGTESHIYLCYGLAQRWFFSHYVKFSIFSLIISSQIFEFFDQNLIIFVVLDMFIFKYVIFLQHFANI